MSLRHRSCGGEIGSDWRKIYEYENEDGSISEVPAQRCDKCGTEILGDAEVELEEDDLGR